MTDESPPIAPPVLPPPVIEAPRREVALDAKGDLAEPVECRQCGYNLQGLAPTALCPECAMPIVRSIRGDELRFCDPNWVGALAQGAKLILIGVVVVIGAMVLFMMGVMLYAVIAKGAINPNMIVVMSMVFALPAFIVIFGAWRLTTPDPGQTETEPAVSARKLARWCLMASIIAIPIQLMTSNAGGPVMTATSTGGATNVTVTGAASPVQLLGVLSQAFSAVGYVAGLLYLARLAMRIPNARLATQSRIVMWGYGACSALGMLVGLATIIFMPSIVQNAAATGTPPFSPGFFFISIGGGLVGCSSVVFTVWAMILLFRFYKAFRKNQIDALENWQS